LSKNWSTARCRQSLTRTVELSFEFFFFCFAPVKNALSLFFTASLTLSFPFLGFPSRTACLLFPDHAPSLIPDSCLLSTWLAQTTRFRGLHRGLTCPTRCLWSIYFVNLRLDGNPTPKSVLFPPFAFFTFPSSAPEAGAMSLFNPHGSFALGSSPPRTVPFCWCVNLQQKALEAESLSSVPHPC